MAEANFKNRTLYHGDNLEFLREMNSECIDLIATDPPFNTRRNRASSAGSYEDNWKWLPEGQMKPDQWHWENIVHEHWLEEIRDYNNALYQVIETTRETHSDGAAAFLCFLGVRLLEMHRILKPTGSIYLHCDHSANAYIRMAMDAIFGRQNFRNEIVWAYTGPGNVRKHFPRKHDTILFYAKSDQSTFNREDVRVPYVRVTGTGHNSLSRGKRTDAEVKALESKYEKRGKLPEDYWTDIPGGGHISKNERTGSPDQKPLALYERIIRASSNVGDWVLDPFSGCATTPIAAEKLGRKWVGIDRRSDAEAHILNRLLDTTGRAANNKYIPFDEDGNPDPERLAHARELISDMGFTFTDQPPIPSTDHDNAPFLRQVAGTPTRSRNRFTYQEMKDILIKMFGPRCWGCDYVAENTRSHPASRFLELDHIDPVSSGGSNDLTNRALLCRPCNADKSDDHTLIWLRKQAGYATGNRKGTRHPIDLGLAKLQIEEYLKTLS